MPTLEELIRGFQGGEQGYQEGLSPWTAAWRSDKDREMFRELMNLFTGRQEQFTDKYTGRIDELGGRFDELGGRFDELGGRGREALDRLESILRNPYDVAGLTPAAKAAMRAQAIEAVPARFEEAQRGLGTSLARRGLLTGQGATAGDTARLFGTLAAEREKTRAGSLREVTLADEARRLEMIKTLLQGGTNVLAGITGQQAGITGQQTAVTGQQSSLSTLLQNLLQTYDPTKWGELMSRSTGQFGVQVPALIDWYNPPGKQQSTWSRIWPSLIQAGGTAAGGGLSAGGAMGCWIAAAIYGDFTPEFFAARRFIFERWQGRMANCVRAFYLRFGERIGLAVRKSALLRRAFKPLFDMAVARGM